MKPYDPWLFLNPDAKVIVCKPIHTIDINYAPTIEFKNGSEIRISAAPGN